MRCQVVPDATILTHHRIPLPRTPMHPHQRMRRGLAQPVFRRLHLMFRRHRMLRRRIPPEAITTHIRAMASGIHAAIRVRQGDMAHTGEVEASLADGIGIDPPKF
jgi:hypothetical protein